MPHNHFTLDERIRLKALLTVNFSQKKIARELGRDPGSISRERQLNGHPCGKYYARYAHRQSKQRRHQANQSHRKIIKDDWLELYIIKK
jgi:IS30 family transposase